MKIWNNPTSTYDIEKAYFSSGSVTITDQRFNLNKTYEIIKSKLDIWGERGSGWIVDKIEDIQINIANYDPLAGSSYIFLPLELNHPMKGLINIRNKDDECFKWCHIRLLNPTNSHPERINKEDKKLHLL